MTAADTTAGPDELRNRIAFVLRRWEADDEQTMGAAITDVIALVREVDADLIDGWADEDLRAAPMVHAIVRNNHDRAKAIAARLRALGERPDGER